MRHRECAGRALSRLRRRQGVPIRYGLRPPGIPIVMPGENIGPADGAWISYLRVLQRWAELFPGFAKEVEGTIEKDGVYHVYCL